MGPHFGSIGCHQFVTSTVRHAVDLLFPVVGMDSMSCRLSFQSLVKKTDWYIDSTQSLWPKEDLDSFSFPILIALHSSSRFKNNKKRKETRLKIEKIKKTEEGQRKKILLEIPYCLLCLMVSSLPFSGDTFRRPVVFFENYCFQHSFTSTFACDYYFLLLLYSTTWDPQTPNTISSLILMQSLKTLSDSKEDEFGWTQACVSFGVLGDQVHKKEWITRKIDPRDPESVRGLILFKDNKEGDETSRLLVILRLPQAGMPSQWWMQWINSLDFDAATLLHAFVQQHFVLYYNPSFVMTISYVISHETCESCISANDGLTAGIPKCPEQHSLDNNERLTKETGY